MSIKFNLRSASFTQDIKNLLPKNMEQIKMQVNGLQLLLLPIGDFLMVLTCENYNLSIIVLKFSILIIVGQKVMFSEF